MKIPKKILVCTDFSENSEPARDLAFEYAKAFGAEVAVLHVVNISWSGYPTVEGLSHYEITMKAVEENTIANLEEIRREGSKIIPGLTVHWTMGTPAIKIVRFAEEASTDLIVMGTHGWTGLSHLLLGSTAENVLRTASCPVLVVRPSSPAKEEVAKEAFLPPVP